MEYAFIYDICQERCQRPTEIRCMPGLYRFINAVALKCFICPIVRALPRSSKRAWKEFSQIFCSGGGHNLWPIMFWCCILIRCCIRLIRYEFVPCIASMKVSLSVNLAYLYIYLYCRGYTFPALDCFPGSSRNSNIIYISSRGGVHWFCVLLCNSSLYRPPGHLFSG